MNEKNCIELCLRNDRSAQKELVSHYAPVLLTVARRYHYQSIEAADILQDSFIQIFTHLHQYDNTRGKLMQWMKQIVINTALKHLRSEKSRLNGFDMEHLELYEELSSQDEVLENLSAEHLIHHINQLPSAYRTVFNLAAIDGYTHEEIAQMIGIEINTSRSHLHRARKLLTSIIHEKNKLENEPV